MKHSSCKFCGVVFKTKHGKQFCSTRCRWRSWGNPDLAMCGDPCVYCGVPADSIDHVPPKAYRSALIGDPVLMRRWGVVEVPACQECNSFLGSRLPWTVKERKEKIKKHLRKKYRSYLKTPSWTEEEIQELGRILQGEVRVQMLIRGITLKRLEY